jgi:hypothetical protein
MQELTKKIILIEKVEVQRLQSIKGVVSKTNPESGTDIYFVSVNPNTYEICPREILQK